jgi:predicted ATPase with chaperone activity
MLGPGMAKPMLACRLTTVFPEMSLAQAIDTTRIPRVGGHARDRTAFETPSPPAV